MLSENIKRLLKIRKLTSKQLAEMVGVSPTHISYIINNKRDPSVELLGKIAIALEASGNELFKNENNNNINNNNYYTEQQNEEQINIIVNHLKTKDLTPSKLKLLIDFIDIVFI